MSATAVATRWVTQPPWLRPPAAAPGPDASVQALQGLLQQDLRRAHHRLALRHYLMLRALGAQPAPALGARCEQLWADCAGSARRQLEASVARWASERRGLARQA